MRFSAAHLLRHAGKVGLVRYNCDMEGAVFRTVSNVLDMRKKSLGYADWIKLKSVISSRGFGFQAAWALMARDRSLNEIKVLIKVLEETNSLSNVLRAELLPIFGAYRSDCTLEDHQFIHSTIDEVLEFPVLPAELAGVLIDGLAAVPNWRDKYQTILSHPRGHSCEYSVSRVIRAAACTAFAHNDASLGWEMLNKITPSVSNLPSTVYDSIVRYHKSVPEENTLFTLFDFLERNHYQLTLQAAHEVQHIMERRKDWVARFSDVSVRGICSCCRRKLGRIPLTDEEVNRLLQSLESFFKLNCKFNTYESQEVQEFKTFLQNCPPYTIVVDGLNLLFRSTRYKYTAPQKTQDLLKGLTKNGHKILVISRSHTQKMNAFNSIFKDQTTYFVRNRSHDDIFIIYAALHGGPNTFVMSNDSFGTHLQELQGSDRSLFRKWQFSCQMIGTGYLLMNTIFPQFSPVMQRTKDGSSIHIPLVPDGLYDSYAPFGWLCLNKVTATQKKRAMNIWPPKRVAFLQDEDPSSVVTNFAMYTHQIREAYAREYRIDFLQGKAAMIK